MPIKLSQALRYVTIAEAIYQALNSEIILSPQSINFLDFLSKNIICLYE